MKRKPKLVLGYERRKVDDCINFNQFRHEAIYWYKNVAYRYINVVYFRHVMWESIIMLLFHKIKGAQLSYLSQLHRPRKLRTQSENSLRTPLLAYGVKHWRATGLTVVGVFQTQWTSAKIGPSCDRYRVWQWHLLTLFRYGNRLLVSEYCYENCASVWFVTQDMLH